MTREHQVFYWTLGNAIMRARKEDFDGGNDRLFEHCYRVTPLLHGEALKAWWSEHDKRCPGPGKCNEGPPALVCNVEHSPPRWLAEALVEGL